MASASKGTQELLHMAMWTLLGMMALGLVLVPLLRPSIALTSAFFGWSNVMVAYVGWRIASDLRRRAPRAKPEMRVAPPVVIYTYDPESQERARPLRE